MDLQLSDRRVLVTGSTRGLGRVIAQAFRAENARVAVNGRDRKEVECTAKAIGAELSLPGDVSDFAVCEAIAAEVQSKWSGLDVLICNVGGGKSVPAGEESDAEWRRVLDLNLMAAANPIAALMPQLSQSSGCVVCISSIAGVAAIGAPATYSAAKAALNAYVRSLARPCGARGVRINAIAPGNLLFEGSVWQTRLASDAGAVQTMLQSEVALQRLGSPEEIAAWAVFLASPKASFATGQVYVVDGGQVRA